MEDLVKGESLLVKEERPWANISKMIEFGLEMAQALNLSLEISIQTKRQRPIRHGKASFDLVLMMEPAERNLQHDEGLNTINWSWLKVGNKFP